MLLPLLQNNLLESSVSATVSNNTVLEAELVTGGERFNLTLTGDTWVAAGATFNAVRQAIIDGFDSAQSESTGWNAEIRDKQAVTTVTRASDTIAVFQTTASVDYDITSDEVITVTIPASALVSSSTVVGATPTITVTAEAVIDDEEAPTGGWAALNWYDSYRQKKRKREKKRDKILEEIQTLDETDAEIAALLHKQLETEAREKELAALEEMVRSTYTKRQARQAKQYNERVAVAYSRAVAQGNFSAIEAFEREMERAMEEEEFLFLAIMVLD